MSVKKSLKISSFSKFSRVNDEQNLADVVKAIQMAKYKRQILYYRELLSTDEKRAEKYKKMLPCFSVSATYNTCRQMYDIKAYNDVIIIDIDDLTSHDQVIAIKEKLTKDIHTLCAFISPSGKGIKIFCYLTTEKAVNLRKELRKKEFVTQEELIAYHKQQYMIAVSHYERVLKVTVDTSGSDIGRLCFISSDRDLYFNLSLLSKIKAPITNISHTQEYKKLASPIRKKCAKQLLRIEKENCLISRKDIPISQVNKYNRFIKRVEKNHTFKKGERNNYLYQLGQLCFDSKMPVQEAITLTLSHFPTLDFDITEPIVNAYMYSKENKKQQADSLNDYSDIIEVILEYYDVRYNTTIEDLEIRRKKSKDEKDEKSLIKEDEDEYVPISTQDINTIAIKLESAGYKIKKAKLDVILTSNYFERFNPINNYIKNLPKWDGYDYIKELAESVPIRDDEEEDFKEALKRWLVTMMASLINKDVVNQEVLVLYSRDEGNGKSTWCRQIIPPEWRGLYHEGFVDPKRIDHQLLLAHCVLINLDDLSGFQRENINEMKRYITQNRITERKAYARNIKCRDRKASIIGSTNRKHFLKDYYGERRFRVFTVVDDIENNAPINYLQLYAQALALYTGGFRYWYDKEEIRNITERNRRYEQRSREDELIFQMVEKPVEEERETAQYVSASGIAVLINDKTHHSMSDEATGHITAILERNNFETILDEHGVTLYLVIIKYDPDRRF